MLEQVRSEYPALARMHNGKPVVWACAPGGTQVPQVVIDAMATYQRQGVSNLHGPFPASAESDAVVEAARAAGARLVGADDLETIHFGANTTSLLFHLAHALSRDWQPGDAIIVTDLDHDANVAPWLRAAQAKQTEVRHWPFRIDDGLLHVDDLLPLLDDRVRMVAVTAAANALGTIVDIAAVSQAAHAVGAKVMVDAVHLAPHQPIDVVAMDADAVTCSAYKIFGPHLGLQWIRPSLAATLDPDKVRPAPDTGAARWETGTVNLEALAGFCAAVDHLSALGGGTDREALIRGYEHISHHERQLTARFIDQAESLAGCTIHGWCPENISSHTPTFGCTIDGQHPHAIATALGQRGISTWAGHFYALGVVETLGVAEHGGLLRIGFAHYNTLEEVDRVIAELGQVIRSA